MDDSFLEYLALLVIAIGLFLGYFVLEEEPGDGFIVIDEANVELEAEIVEVNEFEGGIYLGLEACRNVDSFADIGDFEEGRYIKAKGDFEEGTFYIDRYVFI